MPYAMLDKGGESNPQLLDNEKQEEEENKEEVLFEEGIEKKCNENVSFKEHDFVGVGGCSEMAKNDTKEMDFGPKTRETELCLGPPMTTGNRHSHLQEKLVVDSSGRSFGKILHSSSHHFHNNHHLQQSIEPKFFNNGQEVVEYGNGMGVLISSSSKNLNGSSVSGAKRVFSMFHNNNNTNSSISASDQDVNHNKMLVNQNNHLVYPYGSNNIWPEKHHNLRATGSYGGGNFRNARGVVLISETPVDGTRPADFLHKNPTQQPTRAAAPPPVVGWPPIRSFRKNLAPPQPKIDIEAKQKQLPVNNSDQGVGDSMFVKVNMDGVPVGRKIDLKAFDGYAQFSQALEEMFRRFITAHGSAQKPFPLEREQAFQPYLISGGDYVLTYEDNEGDRMLVGDVPWEMFVSTVKRLRIMKSSEAHCLGKQYEKSSQKPDHFILIAAANPRHQSKDEFRLPN